MADRDAEQEAGIVRLENGGGRGPFVILCDHASNRVPGWCTPLGLGDADMARHIAWDPGALGVARHMAHALDAPLFFPDASRLVIDCNRPPDVPSSIATRSEDTEVPGNLSLGTAERQDRIARIYEAYHAAITDRLDARSDVPGLIALHSFTPVYLGTARPWQVGLVVDDDRRLADPMLTALRAEAGLCVGENEPYSPADGVYHTLERHGAARSLPSVMIEIRNDEIATPEAQEAWARRLCAAIPAARGREHAHA